MHIQELKRQNLFSIINLQPTGDKMSRIISSQPIMEQGRVVLVDDDWNEMFLSEMSSFPYGRDDLVDCLSYSIKELINKTGTTKFIAI